MSRPRKPDAPTAAERNRASRATRDAKAVLLPGTVIAALDAIRKPGETRAASAARVILAAAER